MAASVGLGDSWPRIGEQSVWGGLSLMYGIVGGERECMRDGWASCRLSLGATLPGGTLAPSLDYLPVLLRHDLHLSWGPVCSQLPFTFKRTASFSQAAQEGLMGSLLSHSSETYTVIMDKIRCSLTFRIRQLILCKSLSTLRATIPERELYLNKTK